MKVTQHGRRDRAMRGQRAWGPMVCLLATLILSGPAPVLAAWPGQFDDVREWPPWSIQGEASLPGDPWGYNAWCGDLAEATWWEIMVGYPPADGHPRTRRIFGPQRTITRAEYATILARVLGLGTAARQGPDWYRPAVAALAERGIVRDAGDWQAAIQRREMGEWVGRALRWYGADLPPGEPSFRDLTGLAEAPHILLATRAGVIRGYPDGTYGPERTATRAEAAAMAVRLAKQLTKRPPTVDELKAVIQGWYEAITAVEKYWVETHQFDYTPLETYVTTLGIYGWAGFAQETEVYYDLRPWDGYTVYSILDLVPVLLRDTVALIRVETSGYTVLPDGRKRPPLSGAVFVYLTWQGGRWRIGVIKNPAEYPEGYLPGGKGMKPCGGHG